MKRDLSGWGVILSGVLLAGGGLYAMAAGWEYVQLERGWSQFIAGSVALSGGIVTVAIGRLIRVLTGSHRFAPTDRRVDSASSRPSKPVLAGHIEEGGVAARSPEPSTQIFPATDPTSPSSDYPSARTEPEPAAAPQEIDRYTTGEATYVMMSDGSVEVHTPTDVRRFPSIAALRADTAIRRD